MGAYLAVPQAVPAARLARQDYRRLGEDALRPGSCPAELVQVGQPVQLQPERDRARRRSRADELPGPHQARILPAVRVRHGGTGPAARHPVPGGRRLYGRDVPGQRHLRGQDQRRARLAGAVLPGIRLAGMEPTPSGGAIGQGTASAPVYTQAPVGIGPGGIPSTSPSITSPAGGVAGRRPVIPPGLKGKANTISGAAGSSPAAARDGGLPVPLIVLGALLAAALVTPRAARSLIRRRRWLSARGDTARAHAAWAELLDDLADYGIRHGPGETPRAVATPGDRPAQAAGARPRGAAARRQRRGTSQLRQRTRLCRDACRCVLAVRGRVSASVTRSARWRARLVPASAVTRTRRGLAHALDVFGWLDVAAARTRSRLPRADRRRGLRRLASP